jgi:hypothetical protein
MIVADLSRKLYTNLGKNAPSHSLRNIRRRIFARVGWQRIVYCHIYRWKNRHGNELYAIPDGDVIKNAFVIKKISTLKELDIVYRLTHKSIVAAGYCEPTQDGRIITNPHLDVIAETHILVAEMNGEIVGTNSLTLDSIHGLHADAHFKNECDTIRKEGRRLGGSWRIATAPFCRDNSQVALSLIQETINLCFHLRVDTLLLTFNPKHENLYKRLINAKSIAYKQKMAGTPINAGAVLMRFDSEDCPQRWRLQTKETKQVQKESYA